MLFEMLVEVLDRPAAVNRLVLLNKPGDLVRRRRFGRGLAKAPVDSPAKPSSS